jgi:hypothetical protein
MRYATAVYGSEMMRAAKLNKGEEISIKTFLKELRSSDTPVVPVNGDGLDHLLSENLATASTLSRTAISRYVGVNKEDVVHVAQGSDGHGHYYLPHFIAIDHKKKAVVLAIRGSFTVLDILIDVAGFSRKYTYDGGGCGLYCFALQCLACTDYLSHYHCIQARITVARLIQRLPT